MRLVCSLALFAFFSACRTLEEQRDAACGDLDIPVDRVTISDDEPVRVRILARRGRLTGPTVQAIASGDATASLDRSVDTADLTIGCRKRPGQGQVVLKTTSGECAPAIDVDCLGDGTDDETTDDETTDGPHLEPVLELPGYTTSCADVDTDGCVTTDSETCDIVLDRPVMGDGANVTVTGSLIRSSALGVIEIAAYTQPGPYTTQGPGASISLSETTLTRHVFGEFSFSPLVSEAVEVPADGDLEMTFLTVVDRTSGYVSLETDIAGVSTPGLLEATAEAPPADDQVVVTLKQARVCGIAIGEF